MSSWSTGITRIEPNHVLVRGYDVAELMGQASFGQVVYLLIRGEMPSEKVGRLMEAILVSSVDHGATPPSVLSARTVASTGASLSSAVAAGVLSINEFHGGAIEGCAEALDHVVRRCAEADDDPYCVAAVVIDEMKAEGRRLPGFGHRVHKHDPRTARLFELAAQAGVAGEHIDAARTIERVFLAAGKALPINVDGAIAAVLADLGFPRAAMNGIFMIARMPGLVAHVVEEQTRERPMRRIDPNGFEYDGPAPRSL
ncbi:MAG: citryl-CoA lyase [Planctomycetota bacterium]|jgi:citrate synthase